MKTIFIICIALSILFFFDSGLAKIEVPGRASSWTNDSQTLLIKETEDYLGSFISSIEQKIPDST
jgi:hypothetical protein